LAFEGHQLAIDEDLDLPGPGWQVVTSRRNRGAVDDWNEYLCVRQRPGPIETYEMAICSHTLASDKYDQSDELGNVDGDDQVIEDNCELEPISDDAVVAIDRGDVEAILAGLRFLGWPDSGLRFAQQAIEALR
jgi:hypothetical protein